MKISEVGERRQRLDFVVCLCVVMRSRFFSTDVLRTVCQRS